MRDRSLLQRNANYRSLWLANSGSILGDWFNQVALGQVTLSLTHSPSAMGMVLLCRSLPSVLLGPLISPIIDSYNKKVMMLISDMTRAVFILLFPLAIILHTTAYIYIGAILVGLFGVVFAPAQQATFPLILPAKDLVQANALSSGTYGLLSILGAASGGIISSFLNPIVCFLINSLSYIWSAFCIFQIHLAERKRSNPPKNAYFTSIKEGFKEAANNKVAKAIILIGISWGFAGGGYAILIPTLGEMVYGMNGFGIGILYAIDGLGVLLGAIFVQRFIGSNDKRANLWYGIAYLTQALFFTLFAQSDIFIFGALMLLFMRFSSGIIIPLDSYLMQMHTKPEVRGRIFSLHNSTYSGVMQLSYASLGYLFESFGIPIMGMIIGLISFLCGSFWLLQLKKFQNN